VCKNHYPKNYNYYYYEIIFMKIWNADTGVGLANYRGHSEKILCCMFSNTDSNVVYSGGEDYSVHRWRVDQQTDTLPPEECKNRPHF